MSLRADFLRRCVSAGTATLLTVWLLLAFSTFAHAADTRPVPLTVFAAASLKESMDAAARRYQQRHDRPVTVTYAASSTLARQIAQGAPADVFISADLAWMDWLQRRNRLVPGSRHTLLGNTLVLVAPANRTTRPPPLRPGVDLQPLLGSDGRIALALTASVPAGKYAKAALQSLGAWPNLQGRLAEADNVRAALRLVARGEAPLGVVYGSDTKAEPGVVVLATFPAQTHPPIVYPVAAVDTGTGRKTQAEAFVQWLRTAEALAIFHAHGFDTP